VDYYTPFLDLLNKSRRSGTVAAKAPSRLGAAIYTLTGLWYDNLDL
jgi:hypothetical protein